MASAGGFLSPPVGLAQCPSGKAIGVRWDVRECRADLDVILQSDEAPRRSTHRHFGRVAL
jgi:hypothetical protein